CRVDHRRAAREALRAGRLLRSPVRSGRRRDRVRGRARVSTRAGAVVFDCDGLLIDSEGRWAVGERRVVEQQGGVWSEELRERLVGGSGENTAIHIAEWVGLPETAVGSIPGEGYGSRLPAV